MIAISSSQIVLSETPICISLGGACGPAIMLRQLGLRTEAYPFDWIISSFESFQKAFLSDFEFFLTHLTERTDKIGVIDYYGFHFTHDWPTVNAPNIDSLHADYVGNYKLISTWETTVPLVKEKYKRRIERLKKICQGSSKVIFIREITGNPPQSDLHPHQQEAVMIRDLFRTKYPNLDFMIVALSSSEIAKTDWGLENIKNVYFPVWDNSRHLAEILHEIDPVFDYLLHRTIQPFDLDCNCHLSCQYSGCND